LNKVRYPKGTRTPKGGKTSSRILEGLFMN